MASKICTIKSLDHLVLTVTSIPRTISFYQKLGMTHSSFTPSSEPDRPRHAIHFGNSKINIHEKGKEFEPKAGSVTVGSGDLCFIIQESVDDVLKELKRNGIEVLQKGEIVDRIGARGNMRSVYIRDPDENLIELSNYVDEDTG